MPNLHLPHPLRALAAGAVTAALIAPAAPPASAQEPSFGIHGSNTIGAELMPALIEAYARGANLAVERTPGDGGLTETFTTLLSGAAVFSISLRREGSGSSYPGLMSGAAEIGMSSRPAKDAEIAAVLEATGVDIREAGSEHVVALDGIAVIVHPDNPLQALTQENIAAIFAGEIADWSEVGPGFGPIELHARDQNSGTFDTFNSLALKPFGKTIALSANRYAANADIAAAVEQNPLAIGFVPLAAVQGVRAAAVATDCGLIIGPSPFSVKAEEYPLGRRLYLYTRGRPETTAADLLLKFALSDDAQPAIDAVGFIGNAIEAAPPDSYSDHILSAFASARTRAETEATRRFVEMTRDARRLSTTFRFGSGGTRLDTKAVADAGRLARWLERPENADVKLVLLGFSDAAGGYQANLGLSLRRAEAVKRALLVQVGPAFDVSRVEIDAFATVAPVACNDTIEGRAVNRRVEAWIVQTE